MHNIKANDNGAVTVDNFLRNKGQVSADFAEDYVLLQDQNKMSLLFAHYNDIAIEGTPATSIGQIRTYIDNNFFLNGGSGASMTLQELLDKAGNPFAWQAPAAAGRLATEEYFKENSQITLTRLAAVAAVFNGTLIPGVNYKITGCDAAMYGGTDLFLTALTTKSFSKKGHGKFYTPKYNYALGANTSWGIWSKQMFGTFARVGNSRFSYNEIVTADSGATGKWRADGWVEYVSGNWAIATTATGANGGTATVAGMAAPTFAAASNVIWGGKHWVNNAGQLGDSVSPYELNGEWTPVPFDEVNYNVAFDEIEYEFSQDLVTYRKEVKGNNQVRCSNPKTSGTGDAIKAFQWGNSYTATIDAGNRNITVENSFFQNINNYCRFDFVTMVYGSSFSDVLSRPGRARFRNLMWHQSSIGSCSFGQISESAFYGFSSISGCSLVTGSVERLNMFDNSALTNFNMVTNPSNLGSGLNGSLTRSTITNTQLSQGLLSVTMLRSGINGAVFVQGGITESDLNTATLDLTNSGPLGGAKSIAKAMFSNVVITADLRNSASLFLTTPRRVSARIDGTAVTTWIDNNNAQVIAETAL